MPGGELDIPYMRLLLSGALGERWLPLQRHLTEVSRVISTGKRRVVIGMREPNGKTLPFVAPSTRRFVGSALA